MSLTREKLTQTAAYRFAYVDVPGYGKVGIRSYPFSLLSVRQAANHHPDGTPVEDAVQRAGIYQIIDQLMEDEQTPVFTEADYDLLAGMDGARLMPLTIAINEFNAGDESGE